MPRFKMEVDLACVTVLIFFSQNRPKADHLHRFHYYRQKLNHVILLVAQLPPKLASKTDNPLGNTFYKALHSCYESHL